MNISRSAKRICSFAIAFCLLLGGLAGLRLPVSANDYLGDKDGLEYVSLGNSRAVVVGYYQNQAGDYLVIPDTVEIDGDDYDVTEIHDGVFSGSSFRGVTLPDSLEKIGAEAFLGCKIADLSIPGSVKDIGDRAFANCPELLKVTLNDGVEETGKDMFLNCGKLSILSIPDSLRRVNDGAFANCYSLDSVSIPYSVLSIGKTAFTGCSSLESLNLAEGLEEIMSGAFAGTSISLLTIPDSVERVGDMAFTGCALLSDVELGDGLLSIGNGAFSFCPVLSGISFGSSVETIGDEAFLSTSATDVQLPASVKRVGARAFSNAKLTYIRLPDSLTSLGNLAFAYNSGLSSITVGDGNAAFKAADNHLYTKNGDTLLLAPSGLVSDTVPDSVSEIGAGAYAGRTDLTSIAMGSSVKAVGDYAFAGSGLLNIILPDSVETIGDGAFSNCVYLTSASLGSGLWRVGNEAFLETNISRIDIPGFVDEIGFKAFAKCPRLSGVYFYGNLPSSFGDADRDVFVDCVSDLTLYCPSGNATWDNFTSYPWVDRIARFDTGIDYTVSVQVEGRGQAAAAPSVARSGSVVRLSAQASGSDWIFYRWQVISGHVTDLVVDRDQTSFTMPGGDVVIKAVFVPVEYSGPSSSSSSGGGGGGVSSSVAAASRFETLSSAKAVNAAKAAAAAAKSSGAGIAVVRVRNVGLVSKETFDAIVQAADMPVSFQSDSMSADGKSVNVRIALDPAKAQGPLNLFAATDISDAQKSEKLFTTWFKNNLFTVSFQHQGGLGQAADIAVKSKLSGIKKEDIFLYLYDPSTKTCSLIPDPGIWIDSSDYMRFKLKSTGTLIISEGALEKK